MRSWALITGGSVRLGREIGLAFARAGWNVACHYNHSEAEANALCAELRAMGVDALAVQGDLEVKPAARAFLTPLWRSPATHCNAW
jgi:NAD(P)-dependent dehydrogenase (short-subunit alcohol dehydrogenase family)